MTTSVGGHLLQPLLSDGGGYGQAFPGNHGVHVLRATSPTAQSTAHQPSGALASSMTCWAPRLLRRSARELQMSVPSWVLTSTSRRSTHMGVRVFWVRERLEQKVLTFMRDARKSGKFTPGQAAKLYGMVNFLGLGKIQALKERQYGGSSRAGTSLMSAFDVLEAIISMRPRRELMVLPWTCRGWWRTRPWRHPVKGPADTNWSSRTVACRSGKPLWPSSPRRSMTCGDQATIK